MTRGTSRIGKNLAVSRFAYSSSSRSPFFEMHNRRRARGSLKLKIRITELASNEIRRREVRRDGEVFSQGFLSHDRPRVRQLFHPREEGKFREKRKEKKKEKETATDRSSRPSRGEEKNGERRERETGHPGVGISMRAGSES